MKIAHEAPLSIFPFVQRITDYDYALVHLFESNMIYYRAFKDAVINGREVILDNSIFELGTAFDNDAYYKWINMLQPTWFIIPDVLEDAQGTMNKMAHWFSKYPTQGKIKTIGVIQGKTYEEIVECYKFVEPKVDKVAISFDYSYYINSISDDITTNKYEKYMFGRIKLINQLAEDGIINFKKPHHLLGCALPQEFISYKGMKWVDSVDTSNPVVHGINGIRYSPEGLKDKISTKLIEYMNASISDRQLEDIKYNVEAFRKFAN